MIIGLSGKAGVGKTTVAKMVLEKSHAPCVRIAFGDELKRRVAKIYGYPEEWGWERKDALVRINRKRLDRSYINPEWGDDVPVRGLLQFYATEVVREQDASFWVRQLDYSMKALPVGIFVIVDDVRFPNELEYVRRHGLCYRIQPYDEYKFPDSPHESETALDDARFDGAFWPEFGKLEPVAEYIIQVIHKTSPQEY